MGDAVNRIADPEVRYLAGLGATLRGDYANIEQDRCRRFSHPGIDVLMVNGKIDRLTGHLDAPESAMQTVLTLIAGGSAAAVPPVNAALQEEDRGYCATEAT